MSGTFVRQWKLWAPPLLLTVVNLGVLVTYRAVFAGSVGELRGEVDVEQRRVAALADRRGELAELVLSARRSRAGIERLYTSSLGPESERLTDWIREVKELAEQSGLSPSAINYPSEDFVDYGLHRRSFEFLVGGSYASLRQFVNLLELTDSFIVLEGVTLNESEPELRISLRLSTLFSEGSRGDGT